MTTQRDFAFAPKPRPKQIVCNGGEEFFAVCDQQDRGELVIEAVYRGETPAQWVVQVRYPDK